MFAKLKNKPKLNISFHKIIRISYFIIFLAALFLFYQASIFLYKNFYEIITQSRIIVILQEKVAKESVNMKKYGEIINKLEKKTSPSQLGDLKDPFDKPVN